MGAGTGHHAGQMKSEGLEVQGVDISPAMVAKASQNYPDVPFQRGNVLETMQRAVVFLVDQKDTQGLRALQACYNQLFKQAEQCMPYMRENPCN